MLQFIDFRQNDVDRQTIQMLQTPELFLKDIFAELPVTYRTDLQVKNCTLRDQSRVDQF